MDNDKPSEEGSAYDYARVALLTPILTLVRCLKDPLQAVKFSIEYSIYEVEVECKGTDTPSISLSPYKPRNDRSFLRHLVFMRSFADIAVNTVIEFVTIEQVKKYFQSVAKTRNCTTSHVFVKL